MLPSPDALTHQLRLHGYLTHGVVINCRAGKRFDAGADLLVRLHLSYSADADAGVPRTLICKVFGSRWYDQIGRSELHFYRHIAPLMPQVPVPTFFGAIDAPESRTCALLIEDLEEHFMPIAAPVADEWLERLTDVLVRLHAAWWEDARLTAPTFWIPDEGVTRMPQALDRKGIAAHAGQAYEALTHFLGNHGKSLGGDDRALLEQLAGNWSERFAERVEGGKAITLIHGDCHLLGNVFVTKTTGGTTGLKIIDWGQAKRGLGPHDLMFALLAEDVPGRVARDTSLLRRYHGGLMGSGVQGYSWEQCVWDYRFSLLTNVFQALFQGSLYWLRKTLAVVYEWEGVQVLAG